MIESLFNPGSVAVVGASEVPLKWGTYIASNILDGKFNGRFYPVNPNVPEVFGYKTYPSLLDIPEPVDLVFITTPSRTIMHILQDCIEKGITNIVMITSGFSETGKEGAMLENDIVALAQSRGLHIVGPNTMGIVNTHCSLYATGTITRPKPGGISIIAQSGNLGFQILEWARSQNIGISKFVGSGNEAVLKIEDYLEYYKSDSETKVILMYIEGIDDGKSFVEIAKNTSLKKPIIALKAGRTEIGSKAAASHTGSLAGDSKVFTSMLKQAGVIEAQGLEELFDLSKIFLTKLPKGDNVFVLTNGGGSGVLAVDAIENNKLRLAQFEKKTLSKLKKKLPSHVVVGNPFDVTGDSGNDRYRIVLEEAVKEPKIDAIIVIALFQTAGLNAEVVHDIINASNSTDKPLVAVAAGGAYTKLQLNILESYGIPTYESPTQAVYVLSKANWYRKKKEKIKL